MDASFLIGAIDAPTATIVVTIISAVSIVAVRWVPKTRTEAAVDRSSARKNDAEAWGSLIAVLREEIDRLNEELAKERRECDRKIAALERKASALERRVR